MRWRLPGFEGIRTSTLLEAFRSFRGVLRDQKARLAALMLLTFGVTALELLRPWPIKLIFDRVLIPVSPEQGPPWGLSERWALVVLAGATLLISAALGALTQRSTVLAAQIGRKATTRIRRRLFEHLHRLSFPFFLSSRTGDLLVRLMGDVNMVRDLLFGSWVSLLGRTTLFVGTAIVMLVLDPFLALLALAPLPFLGLGLGMGSRAMKETTRKQRRNEGDAASFASETLRQIRVVKAYAAEEAATQHFARWSRSGERAGVRAARIAAQMGRLTETLTGAGLAMVLLVGSLRTLDGSVTPGELLVFMSYAHSLYKPMRRISKEGMKLSKATACAGRLLEVLRTPPEDERAGMPAPRFGAHISFSAVGFSYPGGVEALKDVSFTINPSELVVVEGPNGSGKSTMLSLLLRFVEPDCGSITIDGRPIQHFNLPSYRRQIAYVPQDPQLFGASVHDNILYGRPGATRQEVEAAGSAALFDEVALRLPNGYDTVLGEGGATLSGGEARKLMLARAALRDASILLLDEPLSGLDPVSRRNVGRAVRSIAGGRSAIIIHHGDAHELLPDVLLRLRDGRLARMDRIAPRDLPGVADGER